MPDIKQAKILIMATDGFEQSELMVPQEKLSNAGATIEVAAPKSRMKSGKIYGWDKSDWGKTVSVDKDIDDVNPAEYDALVLPGGQINPDKLRMEKPAVEFVKKFVATGKPVASASKTSARTDRGPTRVTRSSAVTGIAPSGRRRRTRPKRHGSTPVLLPRRSAASASKPCRAPSVTLGGSRNDVPRSGPASSRATACSSAKTSIPETTWKAGP